MSEGVVQVSPVDTAPVAPVTSAEPVVSDNATPEIVTDTPKGITLPEELKFKTDKRTGQKVEKGWVSKVVDEQGNVSIEKMVAQIESLESLKGQKVVAFDWNNSKPEEIKEYMDKIRPESHEVYDFVNGAVAQGTEETIQKLLHDAALPKPQAQKLLQNYLSFENAQMAEATSKEGFDAELKTSFGDTYVEEATKVGKVLKDIYSPEDAELLESVPNVFLGLLYRGLHKVISQYGVTEQTIGNQGNSKSSAVISISSLENQLKNTYSELKSLSNAPHTPERKQELLNRSKALNQQIFNLKGGK